MLATLPLLENTNFPAIKRTSLHTLQANLGYRCNQQCLHCHVNAGPKRKEEMTRDIVDVILQYLQINDIEILDVTGGAPELNAHFRYLVTEARRLNVHVIDRCNLTILELPGQEDLAEFLAEQKVEVTASLPCYLTENVDNQRGKGVFAESIRGLQKLNNLGYGAPDTGLKINLVYNPQGPTLPPSQVDLEVAYRNHLLDSYGIIFNQLYTLANMPIQRFGSTLLSKGQFHSYMTLLKDAYQQSNLNAVMCRSLLSVDWQGYLYDCDFNQMLGLPLRIDHRARLHLRDVLHTDLTGTSIVVKDHCYGCTAGQGSSCGGALNN